MAKQQLSIWGNGDSEGRTDGPMAACTLSGRSYLMQPQLHISSWWVAKRRHLSLSLFLYLSRTSNPAKSTVRPRSRNYQSLQGKSESEAKLFSRTHDKILTCCQRFFFYEESHGELYAQTQISIGGWDTTLLFAITLNVLFGFTVKTADV